MWFTARLRTHIWICNYLSGEACSNFCGNTDNYDGTIDDPVEDGDTVLHLACLYGHLACVEVFYFLEFSLHFFLF